VLYTALAGLVVLALTAYALAQREALDAARRAQRAEAAAGSMASGVAADLGLGLRGVGQAARTGLSQTSLDPTVDIPGATRIGFVPSSGPSAPPEEVLVSDDVRSDPDVVEIFERTANSGRSGISAPIDLGQGAGPLLVAAAYAPGAAPPVSTAERRERLDGWVVAPIDLATLAEQHGTDGVDTVVRDSSADEPTFTGGTVEDQTVLVADRRFVAEARVPGGAGLAGVTVVLLVLGGLVAVAAAALVLAARRRQRATDDLLEARDDQVRLIGEVAPLVQQSLELAEVLPAVAVQLSDHFDLAGISLSTGASRAGQTELFSLGTSPDPGEKVLLRPPDHLAAGETLRLALQRGGRSVALLQVVAGRDLDQAALDSLRALSELVTAAIVNASLYASQQEALARLRELDALKTVFLSTASHELRTPATAIAGFAGLLTSSWDRFTEEQRLDFANRIGANARSLSAVVQDLLDFSVLDRGTVAIKLLPLDLGEVVSGVLDRLSGAFSEHEVRAEIEDAPPMAGDRSGLERVTTNLLTNAAKFSPPGTTITVRVHPDGAGVVLEVADQGPGVPADERERVFARFYRGSGDAVLATRGVGIGLSVVAEFVTRMHGDVSVDDAPGGGARFTVRFPSARSVLVDEEVADATTA
jgi:signal transduction histidine kinase